MSQTAQNLHVYSIYWTISMVYIFVE